MGHKVSSTILKREIPKFITPPAVIMVNPKHAHNVARVIRSASCFGINEVWFTGDRVAMDIDVEGRLPREERMKGYSDVKFVACDRPFDHVPEGATPVAIEVRPNCENLHDFEHPEQPIYVFGPEDGGLEKVQVMHCHRFVIIPSKHCCNVAVAASIVMYDRALKLFWNTGNLLTLNEHRGPA